MENLIVQAELQDICTFRQNILRSFQKIQSQISHVPTPLALNSFCDCTYENLPWDPFATSSFKEQPNQYSSEKIDFWAHRKYERKLLQKTDRINKYLNEYDLNNFNFEVQPLKQKKNFNNQRRNFHTAIPFKNQQLSDKFNNSAYQVTKLLASDQKLTVATNRITASSHQNYVKRTRNEVKNKQLSNTKQKSEIRWKSQRKESIMTSQDKQKAQKLVNKNRSFCEKSEKKQTKNRVFTNKGFLSHRQSFNEKKKQSPKEIMRQEIYKRIKKRIYLSCAVYKSSRDIFETIYQKELRQRSDILGKILSNPKVVKKYGSVIPQIRQN